MAVFLTTDSIKVSIWFYHMLLFIFWRGVSYKYAHQRGVAWNTIKKVILEWEHVFNSVRIPEFA